MEACDTLYLLAIPAGDDVPTQFDLHGDGKQLARGLYLIRSNLTRSKLYHRIKWQLPDGAALLVATLADDPKFKGMNAGALSWIRETRSD